jgi:hypothetical protein
LQGLLPRVLPSGQVALAAGRIGPVSACPVGSAERA